MLIQGDLNKLSPLSYFQFSEKTMNIEILKHRFCCLTKQQSKTKKAFDKEKLKK